MKTGTTFTLSAAATDSATKTLSFSGSSITGNGIDNAAVFNLYVNNFAVDVEASAMGNSKIANVTSDSFNANGLWIHTHCSSLLVEECTLSSALAGTIGTPLSDILIQDSYCDTILNGELGPGADYQRALTVDKEFLTVIGVSEAEYKHYPVQISNGSSDAIH